MERVSLRSRAVVFAFCAGAVAFLLAFLATSHGVIDQETIGVAIIPAIVCGVMSWASAERAIASTAGAIDIAIARLARAAHGDLEGEIPAEIGRDVPQLASAMEALFQRLGANLDNIHQLAMFDSVTALPNRINFRQACEAILLGMPAEDHAALFFIDLDRFKRVNDTMGHAVGDRLLGLVATRLRTMAARLAADHGGGPALLGRLAGDEFTIFLPGVSGSTDATRIGQELLQMLSEPFELDRQPIAVGASIGIALRPAHGVDLPELMRAADIAMYHAKARGRGRAEHFTDTLAAEIAGRAVLESDLREAIDGDQFSLVFQPQIAASDGRIVAAEALLRWRHPTDGVRFPASFIERAEESGLIVEIGDWVIATVAQTITRWGRIGIAQRLAINVSQRQLDHADFFRRLRAAMHAAGAPAHLLELELTETLAMRCSQEVIEAIAALRADGATIAIDDFGTGYSNLARLRDLPVDRVKLDRSLIEHVADRAEARTIAHAVIGLVHGLGCEAVAEGIETEAQANVLRVIGCDVMQGYAIAPPMDEAALIAWAREDDRRLVG
ncbi:EAL domain-containing protein [Sphingomonas koreensis]|nr:EAL domain-containing protein [Sphingomonas koreensis]